MPKISVEDFLFPWEKDKDGKKLETPAEIDIEKHRKYVVGLLNDKEQAQEARDTAITGQANAELALKDLQQKNESDEERRQREQKERDAELETLKKDGIERRKFDALVEAFPDATAARIRRLAKRVTSTDEKAWVDDAKELIEDGFRITDKTETRETDEVTEEEVDIAGKPRVSVRRSDGNPVTPSTKKYKSVAEELDAGGVYQDTW